MIHHASRNWGNVRKNPEAGLYTAPPAANRNQVRALLGGTEAEAITFVRRHSENESFLRIAAEIEAGRNRRRPVLVKLIEQLLTALLERGAL